MDHDFTFHALDHTEPIHETSGRLEWPSAFTNMTAHFTSSLVPDLEICKLGK